jgi:hypothetical protein
MLESNVFRRRLSSVAAWLGVLLHLWPALSFGQPESITPDQIISKYLEAVGADKFPSIATFVEKGELLGNVKDFSQEAFSSSQAQKKERGAFEIYFKAPNLKLTRSFTENNIALESHGCDGSAAWYTGSDARRSEFKPRPGIENECTKGYEPLPLRVRSPSAKIRLIGKQQIGERVTWEIQVDDPRSPTIETYYFDVETYLLLRYERLASDEWVTYSDYREADGMKLPFRTTRQYGSSELVSTVRELKIDFPLEDTKFGTVKSQPVSHTEVPKPVAKGDEVDILSLSQPSKPVTSASPALPEVKIPNFVSCSIKELQQVVPEVRGLKATDEQKRLLALLDQIGARTVDIAKKTPNLISNEAVVESQSGMVVMRQSFSYLVLPHTRAQSVVAFDEFRVDLESGAKFESQEADDKSTSDPHASSPSSSPWDALQKASEQVSEMNSGRAPLSQGFANTWIYFYPLNRVESSFRYLGEQKMDGHRTFIVAFAQKPGSVRLPAKFRGEDKTVSIFFQGVAWVDQTDFRIVRLRTDLLSPVTVVGLRRLSADIQFAETNVAEVTSPLWLPRDVNVTSDVRGITMVEKHKYSNYRLFRARSKIVLNP